MVYGRILFKVTKRVGEGERQGNGVHTSPAVIIKAAQSNLGRMFMIKSLLTWILAMASSTSLGWRVLVEVCLQVFTAQVRKLRVRIFILLV